MAKKVLWCSYNKEEAVMSHKRPCPVMKFVADHQRYDFLEFQFIFVHKS